MLIRVWVSIFLLLGISYCDSFVEKKIHLNHECNSIKICYQYPDGCALDKCEGGFTVARANLLEPDYGTIYEIYVPVLVEKSNYIAIESTNLKTGEKYVRLCLPNERKAMFAYKNNALSIDETHVMEVVATMFSEEPFPATTICVFRDTVLVKQEEDEVFVSDVTTGVLSNDTYYPPKMTIRINGVTKLNFDLLEGVNLSGPVLDKNSEEVVREAGSNIGIDQENTSTSTAPPVHSLGNKEASYEETVETITVRRESSVAENGKEPTTEKPSEEISVGEAFEETTVRRDSKKKSLKQSVKNDFVEESSEEITVGEISKGFTAEESVEETSVKGTFEESAGKENAKKKLSEENVKKHLVEKSAEELSVADTSQKFAAEEPIEETSVEEVFEEDTSEEGLKKKFSEESVKKHLVEKSMEEYSVEKKIEKSNDRHDESRATPSSPNLSVSSSSTIGSHKDHKKDHPHRNFQNTSGKIRLTLPTSTEDESESAEKSKQEIDDTMKHSVSAELRALHIDENEPVKNPTEPKASESFRQRDQFEKDYQNEKERNRDYEDEEEKEKEEGENVEEIKELQSEGRKEEGENDNESVKSKSAKSHPKNLHRHQDAQIGSEEDEDLAYSCSIVLPVVIVLWAHV